MYRIGIDVGGTFTDVTLLNSETGKYDTYKLSSTLQDQSVAIANGTKETLELYGVPVSEIEYFGHGTTVATNMIIERKGAKTALITTKGFRDLLEIGRQTRPSLYNTQEDKPETLVRRSLRTEVDERIAADGTVLRRAKREEILPLLKRLKAEGVESLAVCFLFSFLNRENEAVVEECVREVWPEVYCSISSTVLPEFREFERLSTTVINSYLGPRMKWYIQNLQQRVKEIGVTVEPYITQSNGGVMSIGSTVQMPVQTALSGPSAGVMGAIYVARAAGYENLITYDMGGTSTDVSLVNHGIAEYTTKRKVCGLPSGVPMIDVHAVGAGGGSIAYAALLGAEKGYSHMVQCYQDPQIRSEVQRAFFQSERAVLRQWSFDREEHEKWRAMMLAKMDVPSEDTVERVLRDLPRKLRREDRLTGPALLGVRWRCEYDSVLHALVLALKRLAQESPEIRAGLERNSEETAAEVCGLSRRDAAQRELLCRIVQKLEKTIKANEEGYP